MRHWQTNSNNTALPPTKIAKLYALRSIKHIHCHLHKLSIVAFFFSFISFTFFYVHFFVVVVAVCQDDYKPHICGKIMQGQIWCSENTIFPQLIYLLGVLDSTSTCCWATNCCFYTNNQQQQKNTHGSIAEKKA